MKQYLLLLFTLCGMSYAHAQEKGLIINEIMQSNVETIMDDLTEFPDSWVELYNAGSTAVNLKDYKLGTKDKVDKADALPDKNINPGEYVIIYCDKEEKGLHTSFRLESDKEGNVYLFKDGQKRRDSVRCMRQPFACAEGVFHRLYAGLPTRGSSHLLTRQRALL